MKGVLIYPLFFTEIDKKNEKIHVSLFRTKTETFIHTEDEEEEFSDQQVKDHVP